MRCRVRALSHDQGVRNGARKSVVSVAVRCVVTFLLGPMNFTTDLLTDLRLEWRRVGRRPSARAATRRLDERYPALDLGPWRAEVGP